MNRMRSSRYRRGRGAEINMAPLIDMIFILLIFFIVTTSFVKESGVEIQRPSARTAAAKEKISMLLEVTAEGRIFMEGKPVDIRSIRHSMKNFMAKSPGASVMIAADTMSETGTVIQVLDECRLGGAENVSIAARRPERQ